MGVSRVEISGDLSVFVNTVCIQALRNKIYHRDETLLEDVVCFSEYLEENAEILSFERNLNNSLSLIIRRFSNPFNISGADIKTPSNVDASVHSSQPADNIAFDLRWLIKALTDLAYVSAISSDSPLHLFALENFNDILSGVEASLGEHGTPHKHRVFNTVRKLFDGAARKHTPKLSSTHFEDSKSPVRLHYLERFRVPAPDNTLSA